MLTITDRSGARRADVLPNRQAASLIALLARHIGPDAVLCSDGDPAYQVFARNQAIPHYRLNAKFSEALQLACAPVADCSWLGRPT